MYEIGGKKTATILRQLSAEKMKPIPQSTGLQGVRTIILRLCHRYHRYILYIYRYMARYMDIIDI